MEYFSTMNKSLLISLKKRIASNKRKYDKVSLTYFCNWELGFYACVGRWQPSYSRLETNYLLSCNIQFFGNIQFPFEGNLLTFKGWPGNLGK
jgi:hypothetical protein